MLCSDTNQKIAWMCTYIHAINLQHITVSVCTKIYSQRRVEGLTKQILLNVISSMRTPNQCHHV